MPSIKIQILNVAPTTAMSKANKPYEYLDVAYKNLTFQGKVEGRKQMPFYDNAPAFNTLKTAQPGDIFDIEVKKSANGVNNDWTSAVPSEAGAPDTSAPKTAYAPKTAAASATAPVRSSYETPDERAARQVLIVRQSSLSTAAEVLTTGAKTPPKASEVVALAKEFEQYVFGTASAEPDASGFDTMDSDLPE